MIHLRMKVQGLVNPCMGGGEILEEESEIQKILMTVKSWFLK